MSVLSCVSTPGKITKNKVKNFQRKLQNQTNSGIKKK